jgi:patatin-like phospholipase/acyl hydrolase
MKSKIRILSIDGGGIRGIISCVILKYIEEQLQKHDNPNAKIGDYFDLIAGSSTGGLITALLLFPDGHKNAKYSVEEALNLYAKNGEKIFEVSFFEHLLNPFGLLKEKISDKNLEKQLLDVFDALELKDMAKPCLITSYDITARKALLFTSHNAHEPIKNFYVKDVCRATAAAPTYFEPAQIYSIYKQKYTLIDGGVYANNPALCAYAEARKIEFSKVLKNKQKPDFPSVNDMIIVSVGTGSVLKPYKFEEFDNVGKVKWIAPLIDILLSANVETVDYQLQKMFETLGNRNRENYHRLMPTLFHSSTEMDETSPENIQNLIQDGLTFINKNQEELDKIVKKIIRNK